MVLPDFEAVFDSLDLARRHYLTTSQVHRLDTSLNFTPISSRQIDASVEQICGRNSSGIIHKQYFAKLMSDLQRRRDLEESIRWDFIALDANGSGRIAPKDSLMLFQIAHGDKMSTVTWSRFLNSRSVASDDVCFDEICMWLCDLPEGRPATSAELDEEQRRLKIQSEEHLQKQYQQLKAQQLQHGKDARARDSHNSEERTKRLAQRKFARWEHEGLLAMLADNGLDDGQEVTMKKLVTIGVSELLAALQLKYSALRRKLLWDMLKRHTGDTMWMSMTDGERLEMYQSLEFSEQRARKNGTLATDAQQLAGSAVPHDATLQGMMGELCEAHATRQTARREERLEMKAAEMADADIEVVLENKYKTGTQVSTTSCDILIALRDRFEAEKEWLLSALRFEQGQQRSRHLLLSYARLIWQHLVSQLDDAFLMSAIATGLAERSQEYNSERFEPDRMRQETLAALRLSAMTGGKGRLCVSDVGDDVSRQGVIGLQVSVIQQTTLKHAHELEVMMGLVEGAGTEAWRRAAERVDSAQRASRLASLRSQRTSWRDSSTGYITAHRALHLQILQEAAALYHVDTRRRLEKRREVVTSLTASVAVLADLQQRQNNELDSIIVQISDKDEKQLVRLREDVMTARRTDLVDNVAAVVLGTFECRDDETIFVVALEEKYEKLRSLLLLHALKMQHTIGWYRLSGEEQMKLLKKKKSEEQRLREDGDLTQMDSLLLDMPQEVGSLRDLMGPDRGESGRQTVELQQQQLQQAYMGHDATALRLEECDASEMTSVNLLADLVQRFHAEQDALISALRRPASSPQQRWLPLVLLKLDSERVEMEQLFDVAALGVGLLERLAAPQARTDADRGRQLQLSAQRCEARADRINIGQSYHKQSDEYAWPRKGDLAAWMIAYVREIEKTHADERDLLLSMLQDPTLADLCDVARHMSASKQQTRLLELNGKWQQINFTGSGDQDSTVSLLEEAAAIRSIITRQALDARCHDEGKSEVTADEVTVVLLAEVQDEQDRQLSAVVNCITTLSESDLKLSRECIINARHSAMSTNLITVLTRYEGAVSDDDLIEALEKKYDAMRDKLLIESLIAEVGEREWNAMTEEQRQRRLMRLRLEERRLRHEGKLDELRQLLDSSVADGQQLHDLLAGDKEEQERRLAERLAQRKRRLAEGMSEEECDRLEEEDEQEERKSRNVLLDLHNCFEQEKDALIRALQEQKNRVDAERLRQVALLRLRQERHRALEDDKFSAVALLIHGAKDYEKTVDAERKRQLELARKRLAARKLAGSGQTAAEIVALPGGELLQLDGSEDIADLQDQMMKHLEQGQGHERRLLMALFGEVGLTGQRKRAVELGRAAVDQRLTELTDSQQQWQHNPDVSHQQKLDLFTEATGLQMEVKCEDLKRAGGDTSDEALQVALLADLQAHQDRDAERLMERLIDQDSSGLQQLLQQQCSRQQQQLYEGLAAVLLGAEEADDLVAALEEKYDVMRDKLLLEALMREAGEVEWARLTEAERQRRMAALKREERRLRHAGRYDDAAALLGDLISQDEEMRRQLGESASEQRRRLESRLARRRQLILERAAAGLAVDDATVDEILGHEDDAPTAKRRNILEELQHHFEDEKAALLAIMRVRDGNLSSDRLRQLEIAKLKRAARQLEREEKFGGAALLVSASRQDEQFWDKKLLTERDRLRALARERMVARRARCQSARSEVQHVTAMREEETHKDERLMVDESLLNAVESTQADERDTLMELIMAAKNEPKDEADTDAESQERELRELEGEVAALQRQWDEKGLTFSRLKSEQQKDDYFAQVIAQRREQFSLLTRAAAIKLKVMAALNTTRPASEEDELVAEAAVSLLTDLQSRQAAGNRSLNTLMEQQDQTILEKVRDSEMEKRRVGKVDNVLKTIFGASFAEEEEAEMEEGFQKHAAVLGRAGDQNHQDEMQRRLAERREARKLAALKQAARRHSVPTAARRSSPGDGSALSVLKREKTAVSVDLSDGEKEALYQQLINEQTALNQKLTRDHLKHEQQVKKRLEAMRNRRSSEAADLMKLAERQRSHLEKSVKEERDRHISMTKERVARIRYEKTMTMKDGGLSKTQQFDSVLDDDVPPMSEDERMKMAAQKMQEKFEEEERRLSMRRASSNLLSIDETSQSIAVEDSTKTSVTAPETTNRKDALQLLKERREMKKQRKKDKN